MIKIENNKPSYYKHSLGECSTKIDGIKKVLNMITEQAQDPNVSLLCDSAKQLCIELQREIEN